jgi:hypothetical protein
MLQLLLQRPPAASLPGQFLQLLPPLLLQLPTLTHAGTTQLLLTAEAAAVLGYNCCCHCLLQ